MSTPQAAVGRIQLKKLDSLIKKRESIAHRYNQIIEEVEGLRAVKILPDCKHAWQLFTYFLNHETGINRNEFVRYMEEKHNIRIIIRYFPIHLGGIMRKKRYGNAVDLKNCERVWFHEQLSLPISPQISDEEIELIGYAIRDTMAKLS
jgi:dTDP-4-amino-4,6-dideoxygalactose transaminase